MPQIDTIVFAGEVWTDGRGYATVRLSPESAPLEPPFEYELRDLDPPSTARVTAGLENGRFTIETDQLRQRCADGEIPRLDAHDLQLLGLRPRVVCESGVDRPLVCAVCKEQHANPTRARYRRAELMPARSDSGTRSRARSCRRPGESVRGCR